jgi:membrane fusion protein, adhesin transport system
MIAMTNPQKRLLSEIAYRERSFPALRMARSSRKARVFARVLLVLFGLAICGTVFMPWQQNVAGRGMVLNYDPTQRHQEVDAPISGRIVNWSAGVFEGALIQQGDVLFEIEVVDPLLKSNLQLQYEFQKVKIAAEEQIVTAYDQQLESLRDVKVQTIEAANQMIEMARQKMIAAQQEKIAAIAAFKQAEIDRKRRDGLVGQGAEARVNAELAVVKEEQTRVKMDQADVYIKAAQAELDAKIAEGKYKEQEAQAKLDSALAVSKKAQGELQSTRKELTDIESKQLLQTQPVIAPIDGYIFKMKVAPGGQVVSQGAALMELVPVTGDRAVAIKVDGNDVPLVATKSDDGKPRKVRLQFEGWPAVQFAGWPSVAVGTFGGVVSVVDATDDGSGKFRVLIVPDPDEAPWPSNEILRQGTQANGWVLLNQVPLGQELWRQVNGFPPAVALTEPKKDDDKLLRSKK